MIFIDDGGDEDDLHFVIMIIIISDIDDGGDEYDLHFMIMIIISDIDMMMVVKMNVWNIPFHTGEDG